MFFLYFLSLLLKLVCLFTVSKELFKNNVFIHFLLNKNAHLLGGSDGRNDFCGLIKKR